MDVLYWFESIRNPVLTAIMSAVTWLGHEILPIVVVCIFYWSVNKHTAHKMALSFFFSGLCIQALKLGVRIDRPWRLDPGFSPVKSAIDAATGYSFPSGHTQAAVSLYGTLAIVLKKWWVKLIAVVVLISVAVSRLYLGVHTPLDVGVAFAVSAAITVIVCLVYDRLYGKQSALNAVTAVMLFMAIGIFIFGLSLINSGIMTASVFKDNAGNVMTEAQTYRAYFADGFKTAGAGAAFAIGYFIERKYINFDVKTRNAGMQIVKIVCGVIPAIGAYVGLKKLFNAVFTSIGPMIFGDCLRYFILVIWVIAIYPAIFKAVENKGAKNA